MDLRLQTLTLCTRNLSRARSFYGRQLGFPVVDGEDGRSFVVDAGGVRLHVDRATVRRARLEHVEPRLVFHTDDVSSRCTELRDAGVSVEGPLAQSGRVYAELADPDGHPIVILEQRTN